MARKLYKDGEKPGMKDVVGMPDDWDKRNIQTIINNYHSKHPQDIPRAIAQGRELAGMGPNARPKENKVMGTPVLELPAELHLTIEAAYPTMFRAKDHLAWFKKNFKSLLL